MADSSASSSNQHHSNTDDNVKMRLNNNTLTKEEQRELLRAMLPCCQPQEGSPSNTFTRSELDDLQKALPNIQISKKKATSTSAVPSMTKKNNQMDITQWAAPPQDGSDYYSASSSSTPHSAIVASETPPSCPQDADVPVIENCCQEEPDWHGAPRLRSQTSAPQNKEQKHPWPRAFREHVRTGTFTGPTNGVCPGFLQCNLVVLPQGPIAFDFLLFCQRNPKACPLIDVCDVGSPFASNMVAPGADLRTDVPRYAIYRNGELEREVTDATDYWPENSVAFLIGCSFSYDGALLDAGIPLKSVEQGKNVPMYDTHLKCRSAGSLKGNMVVSMKPIPAQQVSKHIEITSKYTHAHGGPVSVGSATAIGVDDVAHPDYGEAIDVGPEDVMVFHACGVTPQAILMESKVPFAITHSAGHMFVTDLPSDMGVV